MTVEDLTTEVTAALGAWEECPEYYVRSCATDGPIPKCASDCPGGCKGSGQRPVFPTLWTECKDCHGTRVIELQETQTDKKYKQICFDCQNTGLVLNVTVETLLEALPDDWTVGKYTSGRWWVHSQLRRLTFTADTLLEALSKALVATKEG